MNLNLANKVAIVTGASRGIGRSIAEALSQESMRLVLAARSGDLLQEVAQSCNTQAIIFAADLRDKNAPQKLVALAMEKLGRIDLLVNNGLGMCLLESVPDHHSEALWRRWTHQNRHG